MLRVGLVGAGHLGKIHLKLLHQSDKYELVGFHDKDVESGKHLEAEFGYTFFEDFDELLSQVEVIDIVTPTLYHYDYAQKAIDRGIHFFIEKPVTQTLEQAESIMKSSSEKGIKAQVGHVERYNPAFIATKGYIHHPMFIEIHRLAEFNPRGTDVSVVLDLMIHDLDILLSIVKSEIKEIHASGVSVLVYSSLISCITFFVWFSCDCNTSFLSILSSFVFSIILFHCSIESTLTLYIRYIPPPIETKQRRSRYFWISKTLRS